MISRLKMTIRLKPGSEPESKSQKGVIHFLQYCKTGVS